MAISRRGGDDDDASGDVVGADALRPSPSRQLASASRFVVSPLASSSVVTHVVDGRFRRPEFLDVVVAKRDQLQLYANKFERADRGDDDATSGIGGWRKVHQQPLYGTLVDLRTLRGSGAGGVAGVRERVGANARASCDLLCALSDSGKLSIVRYDARLARFAPARQIHLTSPGLPPRRQPRRPVSYTHLTLPTIYSV